MANQKKTGLYFERKAANDTCRIHAINNVLGRPALTLHSFRVYCDRFDSIMQMDFFFVDGPNNLLSWLLEDLAPVRTVFRPPGRRDPIDASELAECVGYLEFNVGHVWAARRVGGQWFELDSNSRNVAKLGNLRRGLNDAHGRILLFPRKADEPARPPHFPSDARAFSRKNAKHQKHRDEAAAAADDTAAPAAAPAAAAAAGAEEQLPLVASVNKSALSHKARRQQRRQSQAQQN